MGLDIADPERTQLLKTVLAVGQATRTFHGRRAKEKQAKSRRLDVGEVVAGRYEVIEELSEGGMGVVFRASDRSDGSAVALKVVRDECRDPEDLVRFRHEFYLMATLRHPRFADVREYAFTSDGTPCLVMEYVPGRDLTDILPLRWQDAATVLYQIGTALAFLHSRRYIHHDIKPGNVRVARSSGGIEARLIDFGIMEPIGTADTGGWAGTPAYMPPEALFGSPTDHRLDLYGLGVMAFEMITGKLPFDVQDPHAFLAQKQLQPPDVAAALTGVPDSFARLIADLMAPDPAARPHDASVMLRRLRLAADLKVAPASAEKVPPYLSPSGLVARDDVITTLLDAFRSTRSGPQLAAVEGARGAGRTAILRELRLRLQMQGAVVVEVNAVSAQGSLAVLKALLEPLTVFEDERLTSSLREAAPHLCRVIPSLTSRSSGLEPAPHHSDPTEDRVQTLAAIKRWLAAVAEEHPIALLVDDAHWSDALSLDALRAIVSDPRVAPLLVVLSRPEAPDEDAPIDRLVRTGMRVQLEPFRTPDVRALLASMFGRGDLHATLVDTLTEASKGNAAYLVEVIRSLVQDGVIRFEDERWHLPRELGTTPLPGSLAEATATVLKELGEVARQVLDALVVSRGAVALVDLEQLLERDETEIFAAVEELVTAGLIVGHDDAYRVARSLARDLLYDRIPSAERRRLHAWAARLMEGSTPDHAADAAVIADHYLLSGEPERARRFLEEAATDLYEANAIVDARRPLEQLETLLVESGAQDAPLSSEDGALLLVTRQRLARIGVAIDSELASRCFLYERKTVLPSYDALSGDPTTSLPRRLGRIATLFAREAARSFPWTGSRPDSTLESIRNYLVASSYHASSLALEGAFDEAHAVAETLGSLALGERTQANGAYSLAKALPLVHQGFVAQAEAALRIAIELWEDTELSRGIPEQDHNSGYAGALFLQALLYASRGRPEAREGLSRMEDIVEQHGDTLGFVTPNLFLVEIDYHLHRGEVIMAREVERRYLAHHAEVGLYNAHIEAQILVSLARAALGARDISAAESIAIELSRRKPKDFFIHGWGMCVMGELWASQRLHERARAALRDALSYSRRPGRPAPKLELRALNVLAEVALDAGDVDEAHRHARQALGIARSEATRSEYEMLWALRSLAAVGMARDHIDVAHRHTGDMEQLARSVENPLFEAVARGSRGEVSRALGNVQEATDCAADARRLFDALGFARQTASAQSRTPAGASQPAASARHTPR